MLDSVGGATHWGKTPFYSFDEKAFPTWGLLPPIGFTCHRLHAAWSFGCCLRRGLKRSVRVASTESGFSWWAFTLQT